MACLGNANNRNVCVLSKFYATTHGKFYKLQITSSGHTRSSDKPVVADPKCDIIGPADPLSNLRPVYFHVPDNETPFEKKFRLKRQEVQQWNQDFWTSHNSKFVKERKEFVAANKPENSDSPLSADEMSVFYKAFLDKNWKTHLEYNMEWYKKNALLVLLHIQAKLSRVNRISSKKT